MRPPHALIVFAVLAAGGGATTGAAAATPAAVNDADTALWDRLIAAVARLDNPQNRFEYPSIAADFEAILQRSPEMAPARLARLQALLRVGDRKAARAELERLVGVRAALSPGQQLRLDAAEANLAGQPRQEIAALEALAVKAPTDCWVRYDIALALAKLDDHPAAITAARAALALAQPGDRWDGSWIHYLLSKALFRAGEPRAAIVAAAAGRDETTTWRSTLYRMALAQFAAGDTAAGQRSLHEYTAYARQEGRTSEAMIALNLGVVHHELGDIAEAERELRRGLALDPASRYGLWALGYLLIDQPAGVAEGLALIDRGLAAAPDDRSLIEALATLQRAQRAADDWDQRLVDHLAEVEAKLRDPGRAPAPRARWL